MSSSFKNREQDDVLEEKSHPVLKWIPGFVNESDIFQNSNDCTQRIHLLAAVMMNFVILASAPHSLQIFHGNLQWVLYPTLSAIAAYFYLNNTKTVQIFDFEAIYMQNCG